MPVIDQGGDNPELLLVGADRPRPLPAELRGRLEEVLLAGRPSWGTSESTSEGGVPHGALQGDDDGATAPRRLPAPARHRLVSRLATVPELQPGTRWPRRWGLAPSALGAAAAVVVALAVGLPVLARPGGAGSSLSALGRATTTNEQAVARPPAALYGAPEARGTGAASAPRPKAVAAPLPNLPAAPGSHLAPVHVARSAKASTSSSNTSVVQRPVPISGVEPGAGPATGDNWVLLTGHGLSKVTAVDFGGVAAPRVQVLSPLEVRVLVPGHRPGVVALTVAIGGHGAAGALTRARYRFSASG